MSVRRKLRRAWERIRWVLDLADIADLEAEGHTLHCARRITWGDGECECSEAMLGNEERPPRGPS